MKRRVLVYKNGIKSNGKTVLVENNNFAQFLTIAGNKLKFKNPARAFDIEGKEITAVDEVPLA